jgi:hypothetical protein
MNNGEISFGVREAEEIGITKSVASRMLAILTKRGFLAIERDAGFNVGGRQARTWRLTAEPYRGQQGTKEFMRWKPASVPPGGLRNLNRSPSIGTLSPSSGTRATILPVTVPTPGLNCQKSAVLSPFPGTLIGYQGKGRLDAPAGGQERDGAPARRVPGSRCNSISSSEVKADSAAPVAPGAWPQ